MLLKLVGCEERPNRPGRGRRRGHEELNSAEHREEGLGGDARPKRLSESACMRVMEMDAEREG